MAADLWPFDWLESFIAKLLNVGCTLGSPVNMLPSRPQDGRKICYAKWWRRTIRMAARQRPVDKSPPWTKSAHSYLCKEVILVLDFWLRLYSFLAMFEHQVLSWCASGRTLQFLRLQVLLSSPGDPAITALCRHCCLVCFGGCQLLWSSWKKEPDSALTFEEKNQTEFGVGKWQNWLWGISPSWCLPMNIYLFIEFRRLSKSALVTLAG